MTEMDERRLIITVQDELTRLEIGWTFVNGHFQLLPSAVDELLQKVER